MEDPNPQVAGQGFARLRAAGIAVQVGLFEAEAKKLNESFAKYIRLRKPLVTLKSAMTLDGKIADATQTHARRRARPYLRRKARAAGTTGLRARWRARMYSNCAIRVMRSWLGSER